MDGQRHFHFLSCSRFKIKIVDLNQFAGLSLTCICHVFRAPLVIQSRASLESSPLPERGMAFCCLLERRRWFRNTPSTSFSELRFADGRPSNLHVRSFCLRVPNQTIDFINSTGRWFCLVDEIPDSFWIATPVLLEEFQNLSRCFFGDGFWKLWILRHILGRCGLDPIGMRSAPISFSAGASIFPGCLVADAFGGAPKFVFALPSVSSVGSLRRWASSQRSVSLIDSALTNIFLLSQLRLKSSMLLNSSVTRLPFESINSTLTFRLAKLCRQFDRFCH